MKRSLTLTTCLILAALAVSGCRKLYKTNKKDFPVTQQQQIQPHTEQGLNHG